MTDINILDLIKRNWLGFFKGIFQMLHIPHQYINKKVKNIYCLNTENIKIL